MKRYLVMLLTVWLLFLSACGSKESEHAAPSSPATFSFYHQLIPSGSGGAIQLLAHLSVDRVWDGMYAIDDCPDSQADCIVAECTMEKLFYYNGPLPDEDTGHMACEGETWYLWIEIPEREASDRTMRQLLEAADSFVIDGYQTGPHYRPDSEMWERILMEYDPADFAPDEYRKVEPAVVINSLLSWRLIPVVDGRVDTESMKQTVDTLYDSQHQMIFSLDETDPENGLYFQNGSTVEELYTAMERYVSEYKE